MKLWENAYIDKLCNLMITVTNDDAQLGHTDDRLVSCSLVKLIFCFELRLPRHVCARKERSIHDFFVIKYRDIPNITFCVPFQRFNFRSYKLK